MKSLLSYIRESVDNAILRNVLVPYDCPMDLYITVPDTYTESDICTYLDDVFLKDLPGSPNNASKLFGINSGNISDVHFEYDSVTRALGNNQHTDIDWNGTYDDIKDPTLVIYQIKNLKYIIEFEKFQINDVDVSDNNAVIDIINTIFNSATSNTNHNWSINISLNVSNIRFER